MCSLHHKLFDRSALGLTAGHRVAVSTHFVGRSPAAERFCLIGTCHRPNWVNRFRRLVTLPGMCRKCSVRQLGRRHSLNLGERSLANARLFMKIEPIHPRNTNS